MERRKMFTWVLFLLVTVLLVTSMGAPQGDGGGSSVFFSFLPLVAVIGFTVLWIMALIRVIKALKHTKETTVPIVALILLILVSPIGIIVSFTAVKKVT